MSPLDPRRDGDARSVEARDQFPRTGLNCSNDWTVKRMVAQRGFRIPRSHATTWAVDSPRVRPGVRWPDQRQLAPEWALQRCDARNRRTGTGAGITGMACYQTGYVEWRTAARHRDRRRRAGHRFACGRGATRDASARRWMSMASARPPLAMIKAVTPTTMR